MKNRLGIGCSFLLGGHDGDNHHELERIINDMWGSGLYKEWTRIELFPMTGRAICLLKKKIGGVYICTHDCVINVDEFNKVYDQFLESHCPRLIG